MKLTRGSGNQEASSTGSVPGECSCSRAVMVDELLYEAAVSGGRELNSID